MTLTPRIDRLGRGVIATITASPVTIDNVSNVFFVDATLGNRIVNLLPVADSVLEKIIIRKSDSSGYSVTVVPDGAETISGESSIVIGLQHDSLTIIHDGTNWFLV